MYIRFSGNRCNERDGDRKRWKKEAKEKKKNTKSGTKRVAKNELAREKRRNMFGIRIARVNQISSGQIKFPTNENRAKLAYFDPGRRLFSAILQNPERVNIESTRRYARAPRRTIKYYVGALNMQIPIDVDTGCSPFRFQD